MIDKVHDAMKLLVEWRRMRDLCDERDTCDECPYHRNKTCDLVSTTEMTQAVSEVFSEYLTDVGLT